MCLRKFCERYNEKNQLIELYDGWLNDMTVDWMIWLLIELYDLCVELDLGDWGASKSVYSIMIFNSELRARVASVSVYSIMNHDIPFGELRARVVSLSVYSIMIFNSRGWPASGGDLGRDGGHGSAGFWQRATPSSYRLWQRTRHVHCWCSSGEQPGVVNEWMITFDSVSAPWHRRFLKERWHLI